MNRTFWMLLSLLVVAQLTSCQEPVDHIDGLTDSTSVMSFNIRYDNPDDGDNRWDVRKAACVELLNDVQPEIIGMQEVLHHQKLYLDSALSSDYQSFGVGRDDGATRGEFCPIYYRDDVFTALDSGNFWLSEDPTYPNYGWDAACKRVVTWLKLKSKRNDKIVYIFNTHFDHQGKEARRESALLLVDAADSIIDVTQSSVMITGDFNALLSNYILKPLKGAFHEARSNALQRDQKGTFNAFGKLPPRKIDFIFYRQANAMTFRTIVDDYGVKHTSDHNPIVCEFHY